MPIEVGQEHAEYHLLLSNAIYQFDQAIGATVRPNIDVSDPGALAAQTIFDATLTTVSRFHKEKVLPTFGDDWNTDANGIMFPLPILVALSHFLSSSQMVSLREYGLTSGNHELDNFVLHWSRTLLWSLPAKRRLFYDLVDFYSGTCVENPIVHNNRARAIQLLVFACELLQRQRKKLGSPQEFKILLPD